MWFIYDLADGTFFAEINGSCVASGDWCKPARGSNSFVVEPHEDGSGVTITYSGVNSILPRPAVDGEITLTWDPTGRVVGEHSGDAYPTILIQHHRYGVSEPVVYRPAAWKGRWVGFLRAIGGEDLPDVRRSLVLTGPSPWF